MSYGNTSSSQQQGWRRPLGRAHLLLAEKSHHYHKWHQHPHHKKVHGAALVIHASVMVGLILGSLLNGIPLSVLATDSTWTQTTWASGVGASTTNQYSAASNIDAATTAGQISLSKTETATNGGVNTAPEIDSWLGVTPTSIAGSTLWLSAGAGSYTDGGSTLATNGQSIQQWNDQSGSSNNAVQATGDRRPIYTTNALNGRPVLRFDGTNDRLVVTPTTPLVGSNETSLLMVAKSTYTGSGQTFLAMDSGGSLDGVVAATNPGDTGLAENFGIDFSPSERTPGTWSYGNTQIGSNYFMASFLMPTNGFSHYVNKALNSGPTSTTGTIAANPNLGIAIRQDCLCNLLTGDIAEITTYNTALNTTNRESLENYLANKYALAGHTFTLDTGTKYSGAGSLKVVAPSGDSVEALQMIDVADTSQHMLQAYAYAGGSPVTSSEAELYYNGSAITTTYTAVGSGWYRLTATVSGVVASRSYGVQVKATKTVYLDDFSVHRYTSLGTLTSNIFDTGAVSNWGATDYTVSGLGTTTVKVRSSNSVTMVGAPDFSTCTEIADGEDISTNNCIDDGNRYIQYQIRISVTDTSQSPTVTDIAITYSPSDSLAPNNPSTVNGFSLNGGTALTSGNWYNYTGPYFTWDEPADNADTDAGEAASGIAGYYVYFGTDNTADPATAGSWQTGRTFTASSLSHGNTYYLRLKTKDNVENTAAAVTLFTYKFDSTAPANPTFVSVSPSGYSATNSFTFIWPSSGGNAASDANSGVVGYQYKTGASSGSFSSYSSTTSATEVALTDPAYTDGANIFYLRTVDTAGNTSNPIQVTFYYTGTAPSAPQSLAALPVTSSGSPASENSFSFTWNAPATFNGSIKQYRYSVNSLPTSTNTTVATGRSIAAGAYASQQGRNTIYVVAEDEAGNINYDVYASADFYATTAAPGQPVAVTAVDGSNRDLQSYRTFLTWAEPANKGTGFNGYAVYRSTTTSNFTEVGTTSGTTYADTGLESRNYYYQIKSKDNAGQYSAASATVTITPTGKFTAAPGLSEAPTVVSKAFSATLTWETDRNSSSFIEYGTTSTKIGKENGGKTQGQLEQTKKHTVQLDGLEPETIYYYQAVWVDSDGNTGRSDSLSFKTGDRPKISDVKISNITLSSATISWTSTTIASSTINYGKTSSYGGSATDRSGSQTTAHTLNLTDLDHSSTYHFQITGTDTDNNILASDDYSFTTLVKPAVSNLRFESVKDSAAPSLRFTWTTNVPTTSVVGYQGTDGVAQSQSKADYVTDHDITVTNLADQQTYTLTARGVDQYGNTAVSDPNTFTTPDDSRPPKIKNLTIEVKSNGVGTTQKAQIVASWETDEPASSQIEYGPGISSNSYPSKSQESAAFTTNHVVIVSELEPSKLYHLRAVSRDKAGNSGYSSDTTAITGKIQRSVIDIILNSLERSLGFLGRLPFVSN